MKILLTGSAGFIAGYLVKELLDRGHHIVGIDNFSKYGPLRKSYDDHPNYMFVEGDAKDVGLMKELIGDCDQVVAGAAMIGGISYFHEFAYDLLAENEQKLKPGVPFRYVSDKPFEYDVKLRIPDVSKARDYHISIQRSAAQLPLCASASLRVRVAGVFSAKNARPIWIGVAIPIVTSYFGPDFLTFRRRGHA